MKRRLEICGYSNGFHFRCRLVEVTGATPSSGRNARPGRASCRRVCGAAGYKRQHDIDRVDAGCARIVDVKCPSSGTAERNDPLNIARLTERDELKFVIGSREDYEFARKLLRSSRENLAAARCAINFSPVFGALSPRTLAEWLLVDRLPVRLNIQLHKVIWGPDARGV